MFDSELFVTFSVYIQKIKNLLDLKNVRVMKISHCILIDKFI